MDQLGEEKEVPWVDQTLATSGPDLERVSPIINPSQGVALWCSRPRGPDPGWGQVRSLAAVARGGFGPWRQAGPDPEPQVWFWHIE